MTESPLSLQQLVAHVESVHPGSDPLTRLSDAVDTSAGLSTLADDLVGHFVDEARRSGASWAEVGSHLGVTKQAAQQRYVPKPLEDVEGRPKLGFLGRFTRRARVLVAQAQTAAKARGGAMDNADLLDALASDAVGYAARAIAAAGADLGDVRRAAQALPRADAGSRRHPKMSKAAKKTLELALRESLRLGHDYIGTEHLLLGLLRTPQDPAARVLLTRGVTHEAAESWVQQASGD
jgi:hypothetical protein